MFKESDVLKLLEGGAPDPGWVVEGTAAQDDCAVLAIPPGDELCATTDFVRGTGFTLHRLGHLCFSDLGRYVVAANVSDLAAMGANPLGYLSVVRYSPERSLDEVRDLMAGIASACVEFRCPLIGGDSGSYAADVLSGTALGSTRPGRRLTRKAARPGDLVFVSGEIGGAAAALAAATTGHARVDEAAFEAALTRWRRPAPRVALGMALADAVVDAAGMDVSDGLTASLQQLGRIAGIGFEIDAFRLPIPQNVRSIASSLQMDALHLACSASVDFELLVCSREADEDTVMSAAALSGTTLTRIGRCTTGRAIVIRQTEGGRFEPMPGVPWDHQTNDIAGIFRASR